VETDHLVAIQEVAPAHAPPGDAAGHGDGLISVSGPLMVLTWITFGIVAAVLYKIAWKPILKVLENRENTVRRLLEDAETARREMTEAEVRSRKVLAEAQAAGEKAIRDAHDAAAGMEAQARREARNIIAAAQREIVAATETARDVLRAETGALAAQLAARLIGQELTPEKNRELVARLSEKL